MPRRFMPRRSKLSPARPLPALPCPAAPRSAAPRRLRLSPAKPRRFVGWLLALALLSTAALTGGEAAAVWQPAKDMYQTQPFATSTVTVPEVLLVVSKELNMFQQGYPGLEDLDGDGRVDTGFNPAVVYVGYFDVNSCYAYSGAVSQGLNANVFMAGDKNGFFHRVGPTVADETEDRIRDGRPKGLKGYVVSPRSATGVCDNFSEAVTYGGQRTFSGNWLNYIATSRMDAVRKILYGGKRSVDTATETVLECSFVPPDSTIWGAETRSDDTWQETTPLSAYYDIRKYTPFDRPEAKKAHFFGRGSDLGVGNGYFPALRVLPNADAKSFNVGGADSVGATVAVTSPRARYWDWALVNRPLPDDRVLTPAARQTVMVYNLRVKVCQNGNMSETEGCLKYSGATPSPDDDVYKPTGLLQRYGGGAAPMRFGLLTGGYNAGIRRRGGKLRNHVGPVLGLPPFPADVFVPPVNAATGQFNAGGLIKNLDSLRIAGRPTSADPATWDGERYHNTYSWGNPLGEMLYEAVRYLYGSTTPTYTYTDQSDVDVAGSPIASLTAFNYLRDAWSKRLPAKPGGLCAKPALLVISDSAVNFDGDNVGSDLKGVLLAGVKLPPGVSSSDVPDVFNLNAYLGAITKLEGLGGDVKYIYSSGPNDTCMPKPLRSLAQVKGICPAAQSFEGTYSVAAAAYYAHIHYPATSGVAEGGAGTEVYAVAMSAAFPELKFVVKGDDGRAAKSISVLPVNASDRVPGKILGFLNYLVLDWETDRRGQPFHVKIKVNYSDIDEGDDWEGDGQVTYDLRLVTVGSTPTNLRETTPLTIDSGDPAITGQRPFYAFKNPPQAESTNDFILIRPEHVAGLLITSSWAVPGTGVGMAMGYTISGTPRDGTYLDLTMNLPRAQSQLTPKGCPYVGGPTLPVQGCGRSLPNVKSQSRLFAFNPKAADVQSLKNPLWLAAKYGGFNDRNLNGAPDDGEWEKPDGDPANYFQAANIAQLPKELETAFSHIARDASSGTATSAAINSVLGGGVAVQTAFWPDYHDPDDEDSQAAWVGTVYGLFIDRWGNLREDSDRNGRLDLASHADPTLGGDRVVTFNSVSQPPSPPPACFAPGSAVSRCYDELGDNRLRLVPGAAGAPESVLQLDSVWDAGRWLAELDPQGTELLAGSRPWLTPAAKKQGQRRIYFGTPGPDGRLPLLNSTPASVAALEPFLFNDNFLEHLPVPPGSPPTKAAFVAKLIDYVQGAEVHGWRPRAVSNPWSASPAQVVWRLGDVINSKPVLAGAPAFAYDTLYGDASYASFRSQKGGRRLTAYFGANDGMLHAVNLGFFGSLADGAPGYGPGPGVQHELGAEMWAYVPKSALPHLKWLADPDYLHAYYVDMKPLLADIRINGTWRTILVGGLRLGGRPIENPAAGEAGEPSVVHSEVFALDVTDPETEPVLLWRHSSAKMGLSTGRPAVISSEGRWYVIIPSGPTSDTVDLAKKSVVYGARSPYEGHSNQKARLIVLDAATGAEIAPKPDYLVASEPDSFFNDAYVPAADVTTKNGQWNDRVVYFGLTVSRHPATSLDRGGVYRLRLVDDQDRPLRPEQWTLARLADVGRPVTGAVNSAYDAQGALWVVFATGRLWGHLDLTPCEQVRDAKACLDNHDQYLFGLKEDLDAKGRLTFKDLTPELGKLVDVSGAKVYDNGAVTGLKPQLGLTLAAGGSTSYAALAQAIKAPGKRGYKRLLDMGKTLRPAGRHRYELNFAQPKLVAAGRGESLAAFTTFEPSSEVGRCGHLGDSFLYLTDSFTGLPSPKLAATFVGTSPDAPTGPNGGQLVTGGLHTGSDKSTEATIFRGDGKIVVSASAGDNSVHAIDVAQPDSFGSSVVSWRESLNTGFSLSEEAMSLDAEKIVNPPEKP
ncbi:MAG: hypothetical protein LBU12_05165 [Deltaproteobacteria bacterium]|jgi:type IV pilus assembly protein PilY1|nr:hypothetical protein [Deltaproteobacteria bacterium]